MASQPDLVLQLAHHIERDFEARDFGKVAVYVDSKVSLNGRRGALLIDPGVDLTTVRDGLAPATWIYHARGVQGVSRRVRGATMDLRGELVTVHDWSLAARGGS